MKKKLFVPLFLCAILLGCSKGKKSGFDRAHILQNQVENLIIPSFNEFSSSLKSLNASLKSLQEVTNEQHLKTTRAAWIQAKLAWKTCEVNNFGPITELGLETAFDRWPANPVRVESSIENYQTGTAYLNTLGSNVKGLAALEYLLFKDNQTTTVDLFRNNPNRMSFMIDLGEQLATDLVTVINAWEAYKEAFSTDVSNTANAGITLLAN